jgi:hypothetical protein
LSKKLFPPVAAAHGGSPGAFGDDKREILVFPISLSS